jgi:hypothetical protein
LGEFHGCFTAQARVLEYILTGARILQRKRLRKAISSWWPRRQIKREA